ncbi:MAG: hypothetical protein V4671_16130 [Armatimonadota bacterium]
MPDKLKMPAVIVLAIAAVAFLIVSGYRALQPPQQTDAIKSQLYLKKVDPEMMKRRPAYQQKMMQQQQQGAKGN